MFANWTLMASLALAPARDSLVFATEFTGDRVEFARVVLQAGQVYRVEVSGAAEVQFRALEPGAQNPLFARTEAFRRASGTVAFDVAPTVTTTYELRVGRIARGAAPVRIFRDQHATERRRQLMAKS